MCCSYVVVRCHSSLSHRFTFRKRLRLSSITHSNRPEKRRFSGFICVQRRAALKPNVDEDHVLLLSWPSFELCSSRVVVVFVPALGGPCRVLTVEASGLPVVILVGRGRQFAATYPGVCSDANSRARRSHSGSELQLPLCNWKIV